MFLNSIAPMEPIPYVLSTDERKKAKNRTSSEGFSDILSEAIGTAAEAEKADQAGMVALLAGEDVDAHTVMIQTTNSELAFNLALQIRNKVVDAYNEVMRMQV